MNPPTVSRPQEKNLHSIWGTSASYVNNYVGGVRSHKGPVRDELKPIGGCTDEPRLAGLNPPDALVGPRIGHGCTQRTAILFVRSGKRSLCRRGQVKEPGVRLLF